MMRALWSIPVVVAVTALLALGFGKNPLGVPDPLVGHAAPSFALKAADGRTVTLASLHGRPVVMNFFASWCTSCKEQEANLVAAAERWGSKATFVGIIYQDQTKPAVAFTRAFGGSWTDLTDPGSLMAITYGVTGIPETFFIDRRGVIDGHTDQLSPSALRSGIMRIVHAHG